MSRYQKTTTVPPTEPRPTYTIHQHTKTTRPLIADLALPLLQALTIGLALGMTATLTTLLIQRKPAPATAGRVGALTTLLTTTGLLIWFILQHRLAYLRATRDADRQPQPQPKRDPAPRPPIIINRRPKRNHRPPQPKAPPKPDPEILELYRVITTIWPTGKAGRDHCRSLGIGRALWEKYIGGVRGATGESARGILDRAELVRKTRAGWELDATLEEALASEPTLTAYAHSQATTVTGQDGQARTGRTRPPHRQLHAKRSRGNQ